MLKKCIRCFLPAAGLLLMLFACGDVTTPQAAENANKTITLIDHAGKEVTIPAQPRRVVIDQVPLIATYVMFHGGSAPYIVGLSGNVLAAVSQTALVDIAPEIKSVSTAHYTNGELNVEQLLNLKPDVVFFSAGNTARGELFAKAGIPAVGFSTNGDPTTLYADWLRLLEKVFRQPGKMNGMIKYGDELIADVAKRASSVPDKRRKKMMILFNYNNGELRVSGSRKHFGYHWLRTVNVLNAAESVQGVTAVNLEQYTAGSRNSFDARDWAVFENPVRAIENTGEGADFSPSVPLETVRFIQESWVWSWYTPNPDASLVVLWLAKLAYPDLFADKDLKKKL